MLKFFPPRQINGLWGLRTRKTIYSDYNWRRGHKIIGNFMLFSLPIVILAHLISYFFASEIAPLIGLAAFVLQLITGVLFTNSKLELK